MEKRKVVIDRKSWLRGERVIVSRLFRPSDGKMCCLGFYLEACGMSKETLSDKVAPRDLLYTKELPEEAKWLIFAGANSKSARGLMNANDPTHMSDEERESVIIREFAAHDVEVEFVN